MKHVERVDNVGFSESGDAILARFSTDNGPEALMFPVDLLDRMIADLTAMISHPEVRAHQSRDDNLRAAEPVRQRVIPTNDRKYVVVSFELENGLQNHFALSNQDARLLAKRLSDRTAPD